MKERVKFLLEWEKRWNDGEGRMNFSELCREFGVSREVGYQWLRRYRAANHDPKVAEGLSRRPHSSPTKVSDELEDALVEFRKLHPTWGPKKLHAWVRDNRPDVDVPAPSTIGEILKRRGLSVSRVRRPRGTKESRQPFADIDGPNATWCVDFKGHFSTGDGVKCYPLTIIDAYSRFLVRCEGVFDPNGREVMRIFDSAFQEYGLPCRIRSDNGPPFASVGAGGLSALSVWWIRLGIHLERITPGKPQENGRQERFHRTLKAETTKPAKANLRSQQRAFDHFRRIYNEERPHEALKQHTPGSLYLASPRHYPRPFVSFELTSWSQPVRVDQRGFITWNQKRLFLTTALAHEDVDLRYCEDETGCLTWDVVFGPLSIGRVQERARGLVFSPSKGRMNDRRKVEVSGMSSD